jgi:hypothetical protein
LGEAGLKVRAAEATLNETMRRQSEDAKKRAVVVMADPKLKAAHDLSIARMQCGEGNEKACAEARRLAGVVAAPARPAAPARAPARARGRTAPAAPVTTSQQQQQVRQINQAQDQYVSEYLQWLADTGNQAAKLMQAEKDRQPGVTTYLYLDRKAKAGDQNAKIVLFAAVKEFQASL